MKIHKAPAWEGKRRYNQTMSQQQFFQGQQPDESEDGQGGKQPYYWSTRPQASGADMARNTGAAVPKDEPAEDEFAMQRGYQAQDNAAAQNYSPFHDYDNYAAGNAYSDGDGDGKAGESYGTYGQAWQQQSQQFQQQQQQSWQGWRPGQGVPPWARPQTNNRRGLRIALLVVAAILLIKPLLIVGGILLAALGITIMFIVFPLLIVGLLLAATIFSMRFIFGQRSWPRPLYTRRYWRRYQRGSWW